VGDPREERRPWHRVLAGSSLRVFTPILQSSNLDRRRLWFSSFFHVECATVMADVKPPVVLDLVWSGGLSFAARERQHEWLIDGRNEAGPSPVVHLVSALGACMSIDVVHILTKGRFDIDGLNVKVTGHRSDGEPRRLVRVDLRFLIQTSASGDEIERAISLSRERYCSVWHSLRQDIELTTSFENVQKS
jgi:putative redox protein